MPEMPAAVGAAEPFKVVIILSTDLAAGPAANTAACIAAGLAATGHPPWAGRALIDAAGLATVASSHEPVTILAADTARMQRLMARLGTGIDPSIDRISLFPAYAQGMHDASEYWSRHGLTAHENEHMLGVGLSGRKRWVNSLAGSLPLWR
jgi:hypothetical protein